MSVSITKKSLAIALLYVNQEAVSITTVKTAEGWTVTAQY